MAPDQYRDGSEAVLESADAVSECRIDAQPGKIPDFIADPVEMDRQAGMDVHSGGAFG